MNWSLDDLPAGRHGGDSPLAVLLQHFFRAPDGSAGFLDADVIAAHARDLDARHHADVADPERRPILTRLSTYPRVRGLVIGAFAETSADVRLLLRETAEAAAARFWRDAGATSATAAQSVYMSVYRRRWGAEFALQGARMRIARAYLVTGQAEPAPRDPRGGGFDPGDAAAFAAASAPSLPGVPQGQSGFASRGG